MRAQRIPWKNHFFPLEFLRDWGWKVSSPLDSQWARVRGVATHSRSSSSRPDDTPFVLIHGFIISSLYMIPLAEQLAQGHEVHAIDLPGYGRSESPAEPFDVPGLADHVAKWIQDVVQRPCHIVGNSFGCQVGADLAARHGSLVDTLTMIGPTIDPTAPTLFEQMGRLLRDIPHEPFRLILNHVVDYARAGPRFVIALMRVMMEDLILTKLPLVRQPSLVIHGARDPICPPEWIQRVVAALPHGNGIEVPRGSHCVHYAAPALTAELIEKFIHARTAQIA